MISLKFFVKKGFFEKRLLLSETINQLCTLARRIVLVFVFFKINLVRLS